MLSLRSSPLFFTVPLAVLLGVTACSSKPDATAEVKPAASAVPDVTLKGVDTGPLTARERHDWSAQVSELLAPCPETPVSVATCVKEGRACKTCLPAAQFLLKQVQAGKAKKDREEAFHARFDPGKIKTIVTDGSPELGPPDAIITIVEWADFECPFCRMFYPLLDELVRKYKGQVRVVFKFYPLAAHAHGEVAARAAAAALNQGKFWEMHHIMFDNQEHLEQADVERYAKQIGLDLGKFRSELGSKELGERIEKDKKQAEELGLDGTPFVFINGRYLNLNYLGNPVEDVTDWVKLDIELAGQTPRAVSDKDGGAAPAPTTTASASAAASAKAPPK